MTHFSPHFIDKNIQIFIAIRIVNSEVAAPSSRLLISSRWQSLLLSIRVELIARLINLVCFAVFL